MAGYRQIHTKIWKDEWFIELSAEEKLLFIYLFSNDEASITGLYKLPIRVMVNETGMPKDVIEPALKKFQEAGKVFYQDGVVWVVRMGRYHANASEKTQKKMAKDIALIPECPVKTLYLRSFDMPSIPHGYGIDTPSSNSLKEEEEEEEESEAEEESASSPSTFSTADLHQLVNTIPTTPRQAQSHPLLKIYYRVCGRVPGHRDYQLVIETVALLAKRYPRDGDLVDYLTPYWIAWSSRKNKNGQPYDPSSLVWLTEWAMNGDPLDRKPTEGLEAMGYEYIGS